jgi:hypothetical protein
VPRCATAYALDCFTQSGRLGARAGVAIQRQGSSLRMPNLVWETGSAFGSGTPFSSACAHCTMERKNRNWSKHSHIAPRPPTLPSPPTVTRVCSGSMSEPRSMTTVSASIRWDGRIDGGLPPPSEQYCFGSGFRSMVDGHCERLRFPERPRVQRPPCALEARSPPAARSTPAARHIFPVTREGSGHTDPAALTGGFAPPVPRYAGENSAIF